MVPEVLKWVFGIIMTLSNFILLIPMMLQLARLRTKVVDILPAIPNLSNQLDPWHMITKFLFTIIPLIYLLQNYPIRFAQRELERRKIFFMEENEAEEGTNVKYEDMFDPKFNSIETPEMSGFERNEDTDYQHMILLWTLASVLELGILIWTIFGLGLWNKKLNTSHDVWLNIGMLKIIMLGFALPTTVLFILINGSFTLGWGWSTGYSDETDNTNENASEQSSHYEFNYTPASPVYKIFVDIGFGLFMIPIAFFEYYFVIKRALNRKHYNVNGLMGYCITNEGSISKALEDQKSGGDKKSVAVKPKKSSTIGKVNKSNKKKSIHVELTSTSGEDTDTCTTTDTDDADFKAITIKEVGPSKASSDVNLSSTNNTDLDLSSDPLFHLGSPAKRTVYTSIFFEFLSYSMTAIFALTAFEHYGGLMITIVFGIRALMVLFCILLLQFFLPFNEKYEYPKVGMSRTELARAMTRNRSIGEIEEEMKRGGKEMEMGMFRRRGGNQVNSTNLGNNSKSKSRNNSIVGHQVKKIEARESKRVSERTSLIKK